MQIPDHFGFRRRSGCIGLNKYQRGMKNEILESSSYRIVSYLKTLKCDPRITEKIVDLPV
jgi:hypothetical protein